LRERLRILYARATSGPSYPPDDGDLADVRLFGIDFPARASLAVLAATALIVADQLGLLLPADTGADIGGVLGAYPAQRLVLFLVVPLAIVVLGFGDSPSRYALGIGDWRSGAGLLVAGLAVMTPIILALAGMDAFRAYYGGESRPIGLVVANNLVELIPAEFLLRGFLMLALWRRIGPVALVVQLVPFALTHIGKPDVELWSTFIGGSVFAWLDWRTGSILWSALGHVYVLTLMQLAVGGATL
jgi:membrane protease YdiL (CAAX protease family)